MDLNDAMKSLYKQAAVSAAKKRASIEMADKIAPQPDQPGKKKPKSNENLVFIDYKPTITFDQLYGCETVRDQMLKIVNRFQRSIDGSAKKSDWPVLICGSRGLGKTSIVEAAANHAGLKLIPIPLKTLEEQSRIRITLKLLTNHCRSNQPAIVLIDDIDHLKSKDDLINLLKHTLRRLLAEESKILVFCTTSSIVDEISDVDFLFTIYLKRPSVEARFEVLKSLRGTNPNLTNLSDDYLQLLAINTPSFTVIDLRKMLDIAETESSGCPTPEHCDRAIEMVKHSFKRGTHMIGERPSITWDDIGGLTEVRRAFLDILRRIRRGDINCKFAGIALYGPPGCGKTMVAQAMANEAGLNFISIKPSELVDKYLGETEKNIRRVFNEAREHEPCMIYFDEFDGLCGTRGNRDHVTNAIQTLLSEMDGFAGRGKSIILASTNRLEDIDPAMKRPGRLSKHIYVGPPNVKARRDILGVITSRTNLVFDNDIDLDDWARRTENFTGAELDFLVSEAESKAMIELDESSILDDTKQIVLKARHFESAMERISRTNKQLEKKTKTML